MAGPGTFKPTSPNTVGTLPSTKPTSANAGPQQEGGGISLQSGGPVNLPSPLVSVVNTAPSGIISVTQATDANGNTLTLTFSNQTANGVFAGPSSGAAAAPSFRQIVPADVANQSANTVMAGPATGGAGSVTFRNIVAADFGTQTANTFLSGPTTGAAAKPTFRAIGNTDLPSSNFSGTVALAKLTGGGANGSLTVVNGAITAYTAPT